VTTNAPGADPAPDPTAAPTAANAPAPASAPSLPRTPLARAVLRRTAIAVVLVLVLLVPAIIMVVATLVVTGTAEPAGTFAAIPAVAGIAAVAVGGRDLGLRTAIVLGLLGPLTIVAGANPVSGAALMALMCLMVGLMSRWGLQRAGLLVPVMVAWTLITPPPWGADPVVDRTDTTYLLWMAVTFLVGGIFPVIVCPFLLRKAHLPAARPHPRREAIVYTIIITVLTTAATYYVLDHPKMYGGAFLVAAILVMAPIGEASILRPTIIRVSGTVAGSVLVLLVVAEARSLIAVYVVGLVLGVVAVIAKLSTRPWAYYVLMVPTTACLNAFALPEVAQLGDQRVIDNIVGGVLVLIAATAATGYSRWAERHGTSTTDQAVVAGVPMAARPVSPAA